jgi:hypothetical protein
MNVILQGGCRRVYVVPVLLSRQAHFYVPHFCATLKSSISSPLHNSCSIFANTIDLEHSRGKFLLGYSPGFSVGRKSMALIQVPQLHARRHAPANPVSLQGGTVMHGNGEDLSTTSATRTGDDAAANRNPLQRRQQKFTDEAQLANS